MIDWAALFDSLNIQKWTAGKNVAKDCVNIQCPCPGCTDHSNHGGFNIITGSYRCWKCHGTSAPQALAWAAHISVYEAKKLIQRFTYGGAAPVAKPEKHASSLVIPGGELHEMHRQYLLKRGLDPDYLVRYYGIKGTMLGTRWEGKDFSLRIIIPVKDPSGRIVSFQGRDITGDDSRNRYEAPPKDKVLANYKHMVYGADLAWNRNSVVVVEGVFDAWKLGPGAVCTFGTGMTKEQILLLSHWKNVIFFFDPESDAQQHADEYARDVAMYGSNVEVAYEDFGTLPNGDKRDIGDLAPHELTRIKNELGM